MSVPPAIVPAAREATCPLIFRGVVNQVDQIAYFPAGWTLQQMLGANAAHSLRVTVGGVEVPRTLWPHVRPHAGVRIHVEFWPQGGGSTRKWILTVVAIVATIFTYGAATGAAWSLVGQSTAWAVGGALVAGLALSLIAPPIPRLAAGSADPLDQMAALTGTQNNLNPYGVIPLVVGDVTFYPPHAAQPYTEYVGSDQYLIVMLDLGRGDLDVSDIILMGTALDEWDGVEYEVTTEPTLYTQDIDEAAINATLNDADDTATRSTQTACTSASINIVCPQGLFGRKASGANVQGSILWTVAYRATGSEDDWTNVTAADGLQLDACSVIGDQLKLVGSDAKTLVGGIRWQFPAAGQYDVQVTRGASSFAGAAAGATAGDATWAVLRSITPQNPSTTGTTKLVVRIKATDQLTGVVRAMSVRAAQRIRQWDADSESWLDPVATQNCGWIYYWLLTECPGTTRHAADDEMDLVPIADWAADCDDQGLIYSAVIDTSRVMDEVVKDCLACGLATYGTRNGKHGAVRDEPQTVTRQTYTPLNRTSMTWQRNFVDPPHALRCQFTNPEADNQVDERVVYWDGYDESNATNIQQFDLRVVRDPAACWKIARYHLATLWLRPNVYQQETGMDHMVNDRGDMVELSGPVIGWGAGWGRIRDIDGGRVMLAEALPVASGKTYAIRARLATAYTGHSTVTIDEDDIVDGATRVVTLDDAIDGLAIGQIYTVGDVDQLTLPVVIIGIEKGSNMVERSARLTCVDANPGVWTAAAGAAPPFVSSIDGRPWCAPPDPPVVHVYDAASAPDDAGVIRVGASVEQQPSSGIHRIPLYCPAADAPVRRMGAGGSVETIRADQVAVGDVLEGADPVTLAPLQHTVTHSAAERQPRVRLTTASGHALTCSSRAPIPVAGGRQVEARHAYGHRIAVRDADGRPQWSRVEHLRGFGPGPVQHIALGDGCFWAGDILHHNKPPRPTVGLPP